jgi:oxygen-dependent protoporphyrinogen oxidase
MLGALDPQDRSVTIVGAGIAGLVLAERLDRAGWEVTLIEAASRAGGLIGTHRTEWGIAETAAHSLLVTPEVRALFDRMGVELVPVRPESRARFIWRGGRLRKFPLSVGEALRAFWRAYLARAKGDADPARRTLEEWGRKHVGEAALRYLLTPFLRGIYGCRPSEIEVGLAFPALAVPRGHSLLSWMFRRWHRRLRGLDGGRRRGSRPVMMAPRGGMGALVEALEAHLRARLGARFRVGTPVDLPSENVSNVVLCVPADEAARMLAQADPELSSRLARVRYTPLVTITAFVERLAFPRAPQGVGVLLPEGTSRRSLGVLFNSSAFPDRVVDEGKWVSLTLMMGGSTRPDQGAPSVSDDELRAHVRGDLEALFDLAPGARIETVIRRWPYAVPQYGAELREAWEAARAGWCSRPGRLLFGNYTGQVSVRGMIETVAGLGV